jgi:hypothetical protein
VGGEMSRKMFATIRLTTLRYRQCAWLEMGRLRAQAKIRIYVWSEGTLLPVKVVVGAAEPVAVLTLCDCSTCEIKVRSLVHQSDFFAVFAKIYFSYPPAVKT